MNASECVRTGPTLVARLDSLGDVRLASRTPASLDATTRGAA